MTKQQYIEPKQHQTAIYMIKIAPNINLYDQTAIYRTKTALNSNLYDQNCTKQQFI
jgi:hypothetical protein